MSSPDIVDALVVARYYYQKMKKTSITTRVDNWRNSVLSGNYLYMTSEVSFKVFDVSQPGNPVFSGFKILMNT